MSFFDSLRKQKFLSFALVLFTLAIGILIGEVFSVFHGKILAVACGILGGCVTMGTATLAGWIKSESNTA